MEERKVIKISLSTLICIFIILILIVALFFTYYFGFIKTKETNSNSTTFNNSIENIISNNAVEIQNTISTNSIKSENTLSSNTIESKNNANSTNNIINSQEVITLLKNIEYGLDIQNEKYSLGYLQLSSIKLVNNSYLATVNYHVPIEITENEYSKMVQNKQITLQNENYTFKNNDGNDIFKNAGYGYIVSNNNNNIGFTILKTNNGYAFYYEVGGYSTIINKIEKTVEFYLDANTLVNVITEDEYKLKDYISTLTDDFLSNCMTTIYCNGDEICISVDNR